MKYIKIIILESINKPKNIIVFDNTKNNSEINGLNKLLNEKMLDLTGYFTNEELKKYETIDLHKIVKITNETLLHYDDTVYMLYNTIHNFLKLDNESSHEDVYIYTENKIKFDISNLFEKLTNNHVIEKDKINKFIENYNILKQLYKKDINYFEFNEMLKDKTSLVEMKSLSITHNDDIYINPFKYNGEIYNSEQILNQQLCDIIQNDEVINIYMIFAIDIFNKNKDNILQLINLYFPFLSQKNIKTIDQYKEWKSKNVYSNNEKYNNINKLKLILNKKNNFNNKTLIENLNLTIKPNNNMFIVLNTLFHVINLNEKIPIIKYSPGKSEEKIFRLYSKKYSNKLKQRISYLPRTFILKITNELSKSKHSSVSCLIEHEYKKKLIPIIVEIMEDGTCNISFQNSLVIENKKYNKFKLNFNEVDKILKDVYNNLIDYINHEYRQENNYFSKINKIDQSNIKHNNNIFSYSKKIKDSKSIFKNILLIRKKISTLFEIIDGDNNAMVLLYKGYQTNIINKNCEIKIERVTSTPKEFNITLKNINNIHLAYYILEYIDNLLDITGTLSFNEKKFEKIEFIEEEEDNKVINNKNNNNDNEMNNVVENELNTELEIDEEKNELNTVENNSQKNTKQKKDIFGLNLNNNIEEENDDNFFGGRKIREDRGYRQMRIEERDPQILKNNDKVHPNNKWSTKCQKSSFRQPIIINDDEKKRIDHISPGSYIAPYKYGSDEDHQFYYICPEYWCVDENISLNKEDIKEIDGKIVSDKCRTIDDKYGKIIKGNPGKWYAKANKTVCAPCCFKTTKNNIPKYEEDKIDKKCRQSTNVNSNSNENEKINSIDTKENILKFFKEDAYIQQYNKFPLDVKKMGEIPLNVKLLLNLTEKETKELFRLGVEENHKQSFISCLSTAKYLYDAIKDNTILKNDIPTNKVFKQNLIKNIIDLDLFVSLHNGNLPLLFKNNKINIKTEKEYSNDIISTNFYKSLKDNKNSSKYLDEIIKSYENFKLYIKNDNVKIDHTYLWDLFIVSNKKIFNDGYNLIIIEIDNMELESDARIICPTNYYSNNKFDNNKKSIVVLKYKSYYELIIKRVIHKGNNIELFLAHSTNGIMGSFIKKASHLYNNNKYCGLFSIDPPQVLKESKTNANELKKILENNNFKIIKQIVYFNGKIIGFQVEYVNDDDNDKVNKIINYVPCKQSGIINDIPLTFINDENLFFDYYETKNILKYIYDKTDKKYNLLPKKKVISKNKVLGFETYNKLFIPINPIIDENEVLDELDEKTINYGIYFNDKNFPENFINLDSKISLKNKINKKENKKLDIILENEKNYEKFKILVRNVINKTELRLTKNIFLTILREEDDYENKIKKIFNQLKKILESLSNELNDSLISDEYIYKVSDEIIRHDIMQKYYFIDSNYILFSKLNDDIESKENEILLPQTLLLDDNLPNNNNNNNSVLNSTKETHIPNDRYIIDYSNGVNLDNINNSNNNGILNNSINEKVIISKKKNKIKRVLPCGKRCDKGTRCDDKLDPPKCVAINDNKNANFTITVKKRGRPKKNTIKNIDIEKTIKVKRKVN